MMLLTSILHQLQLLTSILQFYNCLSFLETFLIPRQNKTALQRAVDFNASASRYLPF